MKPIVTSRHRCVTGRPLEGRAKSEARQLSYWRSEILQAMFWLKEEGFGDQVETTLLGRFLGVDSYIGVQYLDRLADEGYLERVGDRYKLSTAGAREGQLEFVASFEELMKPRQCACSWESWRNESPDERQVGE